MRYIFVFIFLWLTLSCTNESSTIKSEYKEVVINEGVASLNGTITEVLYRFKLDSLIEAVDITSTFPSSAKEKPSLGHVRSIQLESLLSINARHILAIEGEIPDDMVNQIRNAGRQLHLFKPLQSKEDLYEMVSYLAELFKIEFDVESFRNQIENDLEKVHLIKEPPRVLFIYARGGGTLLVAGQETSIGTMIKYAGGQNAIEGIKGYVPLNPESLIESNPDIILMFEEGYKSLELENGMSSVRGYKLTNASKNEAICTMNGLLLSGMGPRLGEAVRQLNNCFLNFKEKDQLL